MALVAACGGRVSSDGVAVIAAAGENPSWLLATAGLDQATTEDLAAALARVGR